MTSTMGTQDSRFTSGPMFRRDHRLREARINAERAQREMRRDRMDLERKERILLTQLRSFAAKGDIHKAKLLAQQIANYRATADRNFEGSVMIETRAQLMVSNHVVNRAEVEAIKGIRHANQEENLKTVTKREHKYDERLDMSETMESIMNEGMDEVYEWAEDQRKRPTYFEQEVDAIMRQGLDPKHRREFIDRDALDGSVKRHSLHLNLRLYDESSPPTLRDLIALSTPRRSFSTPIPTTQPTLKGATVTVPTLDLSVDMLKRLITKDFFATRQMGLSTPSKSVYDAVLGSTVPFRVGSVTAAGDGEGGGGTGGQRMGKFVPFDFQESLKNLGIKSGDSVWILPSAVEGDAEKE